MSRKNRSTFLQVTTKLTLARVLAVAISRELNRGEEPSVQQTASFKLTANNNYKLSSCRATTRKIHTYAIFCWYENTDYYPYFHLLGELKGRSAQNTLQSRNGR